MVIMAIDYGDVRTGIAVCDKNQILASPLCMIKETDSDRLAAEINKLCSEHSVEKIVIGLPRNMDGSEGFRAEICRDFAKLVFEKTGLEVVMHDERLTTVSAHRALSEAGVFGKKRKQSVDVLSAVMILQDYIDSL